MKNYHILLVDDEKRLIQCLVFVLSLEGHCVTTAENGEEALAIIRESLKNGPPIDLLITDLFMPQMSGINLIDRLAAERIDLTVIGISGHPDLDTLTELNRGNCTHWIEKPFTPEALLSKIDEVMNGR